MDSLLSLSLQNPNAITSVATATAANTATTSNVSTPILVPKLEPFDEWLTTQNPQPHHQEPHHRAIFSTPAPDGFAGSHHALFCDQNPASLETPGVSSQENHLYSEFFRVSELFKDAFSKTLQQFGDSEVVSDPNSRAVVPRPPPDNQVSSSVTPTRQSRWKELVRVTGIGVKDQRHFRDVMRRTRMIYNSLRVLSTVEDDQRGELFNSRRVRGDLRASNLMKNCGLWLNRDKRIVGAIPGICIGDVFLYRMELCVVGLHWCELEWRAYSD